MSVLDDVTGAVKQRPWLLALPAAVVAYWWWSRRDPGAVPVEEEETDTEGLDGGQFTGREPGPVGDGDPGGTPTIRRPTTNAEWESAAIDYLIGRGYQAAYAQTAITKALGGEPLTTAEKALVGLAIFALGSPPEGMPPLGAEPPPTAPPTTPPGTTTPPPATPGRPGTLSASNATRTSVNLRWGAATGAVRYRLHRSGGLAPGGTLLVAGTSRTVTGLKPGRTYYFAVAGVNSRSKDGPATNTVKVNTPR